MLSHMLSGPILDPQLLLYPTVESCYQSLGGGKHFCLACGYKANKYDMTKHVQRKHMKRLKFPCTMCDKELGSEVDRKLHYSRVHQLQLSIGEIAKLKRFEEF